MKDILRINFVGDLCFQEIDPAADRVAPELIELFEQADINVANLEGPLTRGESRIPGQGCYLKGRPEPSVILDHFDVFSLANNHILDFGQEGLADTKAFLADQGKLWFGAGLDREEANQPLRIQRSGIQLAFVGFTRWYNAKGRRAGTSSEKVRRIVRDIRNLKKDGCFVVLYPHWNYEYVDYPSPIERKQAMRFIDAGADLVVGSHPHVVQGIEQYKGKYICYSLGNFIFHPSLFSRQDARLFKTFILTVELQADHEYDVSITPVQFDGRCLRRLVGGDEAEFRAMLRNLSSVFDDNNRYKKLFYRESNNIIRDTMNSLRSASTGKGGSLMALARRLPRLQWQDVLIKLHSLGRGCREHKSQQRGDQRTPGDCS